MQRARRFGVGHRGRRFPDVDAIVPDRRQRAAGPRCEYQHHNLANSAIRSPNCQTFGFTGKSSPLFAPSRRAVRVSCSPAPDRSVRHRSSRGSSRSTATSPWTSRARRIPPRTTLTGSQKFGLMNQVSESLAGRISVLELEPLSLAEIAITRGERVERVPSRSTARGPEAFRYPRRPRA